MSSTVITVVPAGSPPSSVLSSPSAPKILNIKVSSFVVVTVGQVGVEEVPLSIELIFMGVVVSIPYFSVFRTKES